VVKKNPIVTGKAPGAIGPYSQGIDCGPLTFVSGQTPLRPDGAVAPGGVAEQTQQCLENVRQILIGAGLTMDDVVKTTVFMTDLGKFAEMNEVYARHFRPPFPARSTVQVAALPKGVGVEIEAIAARS
jgi:2-iminobutanoate/2-iminopropanoate deaminase